MTSLASPSLATLRECLPLCLQLTPACPGPQINGIITQGENIADNGGLKEARRAYGRYQEENGVEQALPGLQHYSSEQMFWLTSANSWCQTVKPQSLKNRLLTDSHSPARARINIPFRNLEQFADDWHCPLGSKMNPVHKCKVW